MKTKSTLLTGMILLGNIAFAQPANDICDDAIDISELLTGEIGAGAELGTYSNVDATSFKLVGFSNGAALSNRINIENEDPRITHILTDSSQLNTYQYRGGHFYIGGGSNQYDIRKSSFGPRAPRKVLAVVGGRDLSVPAEGGASIDIEDGEGGPLEPGAYLAAPLCHD